MGNSAGATGFAIPRCSVPQGAGYTVDYDCYAVVDGVAHFDFKVHPPVALGAPAYNLVKTYEDFQGLDDVLRRRYQRLRALPAYTFFTYTDEDFLVRRAAGLEAYLVALLQLEPLPRSQVLRRFLGVSQPLPRTVGELQGQGWLQEPTPLADGSCAGVSPCTCGSYRLPAGLVGTALSFVEPFWMLRTCAMVCRAFWLASRDPRCWRTLRYRSREAERRLDGLYSVLLPASGSILDIHLDLAFEIPSMAIALPSGVKFPQLRRLSLRLGDAEAVNLGADLLSCVESRGLRQVEIEGGILTAQLLSALQMAALEAQGGLVGVRLVWASTVPSELLLLDEGVATVLAGLPGVLPNVEQLKIGIPDNLRGRSVSRFLAEGVRVGQPLALLSDIVSLSALRDLTFDFLSDDVLIPFGLLADRSLFLRRARFSGLKQGFANPEDTLVTLLLKLGDCLEELALLVEMEAEMRPFMRDVLLARIGALPNQWSGRDALRILELNWVAFDDNGVACIVEHCPRLESLILERTEYWTDETPLRISTGLHELRHFRLRSSNMLTDRSLYALAEVSHRFVSLELEQSYSMSSHAIGQLKTALDNSDPLGLATPGWGDRAGRSFLGEALMAVQMSGDDIEGPRSGRVLRLLAAEDEE